jgi:rod shape-determining protein MreC
VLRRFASRNGGARTKRAVTLALCSLGLIALDICDVWFIAQMKHGMVTVLMPVKRFVVAFKELPEIVHRYVSLKQENEELKLKVDELKGKILIINEVEQELVELKKIMNLKHTSNMFNAMEKVLGTDKSVFESFVIISALHKRSRVGSVVISSDGLVGMIYDVVGAIARVLPVTNPKIFVPVKTKSGVHMIMSGTGRNEMVSIEIRDAAIEKVNVEDELYTSGEGGVFRDSISVAKVTSVDMASGRVTAKPIVNIDELGYAWVLEPVMQTRSSE